MVPDHFYVKIIIWIESFFSYVIGINLFYRLAKIDSGKKVP